MKIVIGESEPNKALRLKEIIHSFNCKVVAIGYSKSEILELISCHKPDLVLLDVLLEKKYIGIEIGNYLKHQLHIPFIYLISPSDKKVLNKILKTKPNGYILKPFESLAVLTAVKIAMNNFKSKKKKNYILLKRGLLKFKLALNKILFIKSDDNYIEIYTKDKKYIQRLCLKNLYNEIASKGFIRVHRSYIVNKHHLKKIKNHQAEIEHFKIPVSRTYLKAFKI